jgi:hypothetical protein
MTNPLAPLIGYMWYQKLLKKAVSKIEQSPIRYFDNKTICCCVCNKLKYGGYTGLPDSQLCVCVDVTPIFVVQGKGYYENGKQYLDKEAEYISRYGLNNLVAKYFITKDGLRLKTEQSLDEYLFNKKQ